ncbi:NfeD family protein [Bacillus sp. JJ722]|uniref:NfeD family protein n=1 Tax=Bacillus sp. JJ722 TaxID=3122973 RepID=UPI002FFF7AAA
MRKWFSLLLLTLLAFSWLSLPTEASAAKPKVYVVPVEDTIEKGLYAFLQRALSVAEENNADAVIFQINTLGGAVNAAWDIGELFANSPIKTTVAWVDKQALSAGAYIALNASEIYMSPGSTMGSAAIIDSEGNAADKKAQSSWIGSMKSAAEQNNRDPKYAEAMADVNNTLTHLGAGQGKLLTLTNKQAAEIGYSEGTVENLDDVLKQIGLEDAEVRSIDESFAEKTARFLTNPVVIPILLTIGALGLVIELFSPGFGIPGFVGITSLGLFFYGHLIAGLTGYETIILFILGLALLIMELFVPGGIVGALGFVSVVGSLFIAGENNTHMAVSILIALVVSLSVSILMVKVFGKQMKFLRRMILTDSTSAESGYVSNVNRLDLIGREGVTLTPLRPSGIAYIDDERVDVVSEGSFVAKDMPVKVVKTEGSRIVVRQVQKTKEG